MQDFINKLTIVEPPPKSPSATNANSNALSSTQTDPTDDITLDSLRTSLRSLRSSIARQNFISRVKQPIKQPGGLIAPGSVALEHQSYQGRPRDVLQESALSKRLHNWHVIEHIAGFIDVEDWPNFARSCRVHYAIAQPFLWNKPTLTLKQAQLFLGGVYRKPIVSEWAVRVGKGKLECHERTETVSHVTFDFAGEDAIMADVCEGVVKRIRGFCPKAFIEVRVLGETELCNLWLHKKSSGENGCKVHVKHYVDSAQETILELEGLIGT